MRKLPLLVFTFSLSACSFAPITVPVDDFYIRTGSSGSDVCYTEVTESVSVKFRSVFYEGDAFYTPGPSVGDNSTVRMAVFGRASDPNPASSDAFKCVKRSDADILLADDLELVGGESQRIRAGGGELAKLVTQERYWLGGSLDDSSLFSFPGDITFTKGVVKANF